MNIRIAYLCIVFSCCIHTYSVGMQSDRTVVQTINKRSLSCSCYSGCFSRCLDRICKRRLALKKYPTRAESERALKENDDAEHRPVLRNRSGSAAARGAVILSPTLTATRVATPIPSLRLDQIGRFSPTHTSPDALPGLVPQHTESRAAIVGDAA